MSPIDMLRVLNNCMVYYLSLGSNVGDRLLFLQKAVSGLAQFGTVKKKSSVYNSDPLAEMKQEIFLNAIIKFETELKPIQLLEKIKQLEKSIGRTKSYHWGPREIDIDIVEYNGPEIKSEKLTIPHPELEKRKFVLLPLMEIENDFKVRSGQTIYQILQLCSDAGKVKSIKHEW